MKGSSSQRTGPNGAWLLSASNVKKIRPNDNGVPACLRRWGFERLMGLKEPSNASLEKGSAYHLEMELWLTKSLVPTSKAAMKALKTARLQPGTVQVETPVRFDLYAGTVAMTCWLGFIDFCYADTPSGPQLPGEGDDVVIGDWKFTSRLTNARSAEELQNDEAATIYAYEAYLGGAKSVRGRWVYVTMDGASSKEVWFDLPFELVCANMARLHTDGLWMEEQRTVYRDGKLKVLDMAPNPNRCNDYNRSCHLLGTHCTPPSKKRFSLTGAVRDMDFMSRIGSFPGAEGPQKKIPPPLPPKKAIDTAWEKHAADLKERTDAEVGVPERGTINAPEAPAVAPRTPEEAAAQQGITKPEPAPPDDLDAMERDALKLLGIQLGLWDKSKSSRAPSMRDEIRLHRKATGAGLGKPEINRGLVFADAEVVTPQPSQEEGRQTLQQIEAAVEKVEAAAKLLEAANESFVLSEEIVLAEEIPLIERSAAVAGTLLLNCDVVGSPKGLLRQAELVRMAEEELGVPDFRLIDFGKGPGELACAVRSLFSDGRLDEFTVFQLDTRTDGGRALVDVLFQKCENVIRGY